MPWPRSTASSWRWPAPSASSLKGRCERPRAPFRYSRAVSARTRRAALLAIGAVALAARMWAFGFGAMQPLARPDEEFFALCAIGLFSHPYDALANGWPGCYASLAHAMLRLERIFSLGDANHACALAVRHLSIYLTARILNAVIEAASILSVYGLARTSSLEGAGLF